MENSVKCAFTIQLNNGEIKGFCNQLESNESVECKTDFPLPLHMLFVAGAAFLVATSVLPNGNSVQLPTSPPALIRQSESPLNNLGGLILSKGSGVLGINLPTSLSMIKVATDLSFDHIVSNYSTDGIISKENNSNKSVAYYELEAYNGIQEKTSVKEETIVNNDSNISRNTIVYGSLGVIGIIVMLMSTVVSFVVPLFDVNIAYVLLPLSLVYLAMIGVDYWTRGRNDALS